MTDTPEHTDPAELAELATIRDELGPLRERVTDLESRRSDLWVKLRTEDGLTYPAIAHASGVTPERVNGVVNKRTR